MPETDTPAGRVWIDRHDSALGRWTEAVCLPGPELADHVEATWLGDGHSAYRRDRILPRGTSLLLINLGPPQLLVDPGGGPPEVFRDAWVAGQQDTFLETEAPEGARLVGVVFRPWGAWSLLGWHQADLAGEVVDLAAVVGDREARGLREHLGDAGDTLEVFARLEGWLLRGVAAGRGVHPATRWTVDRLLASFGSARVDRLAEAAGYSRKYLTRVVRREVGLPPKVVARIARFHHAVGRLRTSPPGSWSEVAVDCGFYDQSHLIQEVRAFAGCAPGELLERPAPDDYTLVVD
jgi:AraC-like DNA-binding protein